MGRIEWLPIAELKQPLEREVLLYYPAIEGGIGRAEYRQAEMFRVGLPDSVPRQATHFAELNAP